MKKLFPLILGLLSISAFAKYENIQTYEQHKNELKTATINGQKIAYIDEGEGQPIVLMHGIPTNSWMYRKMIPSLVKKGYRVIAPDLLGMGQSSKGQAEEELYVDSQSDYMLALLSGKLKLKNWTHVVHDMAGPITWEMSEDKRFSIKELVILNTLAFKNGFKPGLNIFTKALVSAGTGLAKGIFYKQAIKSMITKSSYRSMNGLQKSEMLNGYITPLKNGGSRTYKCMYFQANNLKSEFNRYQRNLVDIKNSGVKVKIVWGRFDKFLLNSTQRPQFERLLGVKKQDVLVLNNAKHIITEEAPQRIVNFIK